MSLGPCKNQQEPLPGELWKCAPQLWVFPSAHLNLCSLSWLAKSRTFFFFLNQIDQILSWNNSLVGAEHPGVFWTAWTENPHCFLFCFVSWHAWPSLSSVLSHSDSITYNNKRYPWHQQRRLAALGCITPYLSNYIEINKNKQSLLLPGQNPRKYTAE